MISRQIWLVKHCPETWRLSDPVSLNLWLEGSSTVQYNIPHAHLELYWNPPIVEKKQPNLMKIGIT